MDRNKIEYAIKRLDAEPACVVGTVRAYTLEVGGKIIDETRRLVQESWLRRPVRREACNQDILNDKMADPVEVEQLKSFSNSRQIKFITTPKILKPCSFRRGATYYVGHRLANILMRDGIAEKVND